MSVVWACSYAYFILCLFVAQKAQKGDPAAALKKQLEEKDATIANRKSHRHIRLDH